MNTNSHKNMYNGCIHEQQIYNGKIQCQNLVYVDVSKVHRQYQILDVCVWFQSIQDMQKTRFQRLEQNMSMTMHSSSNHFI